MKELSLFTGGGGSILGSHLLGWTPVGYVEWDEYAQQILAARIRDGVIRNAPIFTDIDLFNDHGYAAAYTGLVDLVSAGFPCQPFSEAGKKAGANDSRNKWPATIRTIRTVRPRYCLLENVPGLVTSGYFGTILGDLAESGFDCRWRILSAAELGATHKRDRLWIVAYAKGEGLQERGGVAGGDQKSNKKTKESRGYRFSRCYGPACQWTKRDWINQAVFCRRGDGMAHRVDRIRAIGNGQVPGVAAAAWKLLTADLSGN